MSQWLQVHAKLQEARQQAQEMQHEGPRVVIVGQRDCGKTALATTLMAYAHKMGSQPLFVDLDPSGGTLLMPTTIGAAQIDRMDMQYPTLFATDNNPPLCFYFGHESP